MDLVTTDGLLPVEKIRQQVALVSQLLREVMIKDTHYGAIPGCGDKPALLKPGAEKICMMFRLAVSGIEVDERDLGGGHREYRINCMLTSPDGHVVARGVGTCTTMEKKYRYRSDNTGRPVPAGYWKDRDPTFLGGPQFSPRKTDKGWVIVQQIENDNIADSYNTVLKMAKKRAHVDATITATACSDIFVQDEDAPAFDPESGEVLPAEKPTVKAPQAKSSQAAPPAQATQQNGALTDAQIKVITSQREAAGLTEAELCQLLKIEKLTDLPASRINEAIGVCKNG